ncbi:MAG: glycerophosphodiester phosphodiesterase [bacterium]
MNTSTSQRPLLISHRGDTTKHKENTLEGFLSAFERGADGVEMDVQLVGDDVVIVHNYIHEDRVKYPKLIDVLDQIHAKGRLEIEVKSFDTNILPPLKQVLDRYQSADIELTTSEMPLAPHIKQFFKHLKFGLIVRESIAEAWMPHGLVAHKISQYGKLTGTDVLHIPFKILQDFGDKSLVDSLHSNGFRVHTHLPNIDSQVTNYQTIVTWGADQCSFDGEKLYVIIRK